MRLLIIAVLVLISTASYAEEEIRHYFEALDSGYALPVHGEYLVSHNELKEFYLNRNYKPVWYQNGQLIEAATELYLAVETVAVDGFRPEDYHNRALQQFCPAEQLDRFAHCDLLFTDAFFLLAQHLQAGKVNPNTFSLVWAPEERRDNLVLLLEKALAENSVKSLLANLRPNSLDYERLMAALRRLRVATRYPEWSRLNAVPAIEPGQQDTRLQPIIERLVFWGDMAPPSVPIDHYDEGVQQAIQRFQTRHGLEATGVINADTVDALNVNPTVRAQQIMSNLERWRWLDESLGPNHVLVDLANSQLDAVKNTRPAFTTSITVNPSHHKTSLFSSLIHYFVVNPGWTVPKEIALRELVPSVHKDKNYLSRHGFLIFSGTKLLTPDAVNWGEVNRDNFAYRLVQSPGPRNALGQVKFMFPNQHNVLLHGVPQEDVYRNEEAGFTAGSIRVEKSLELAAWLLDSELGARSQVDRVLEKGAPQALYLREPLPVHIAYRTAWVNSQGILNFRPDIYGRDRPLYEALIQPLSDE